MTRVSDVERTFSSFFINFSCYFLRITSDVPTFATSYEPNDIKLSVQTVVTRKGHTDYSKPRNSGACAF